MEINLGWLSPHEIQNAIDQVRAYQQDFNNKVETFINRLIDLGYKAAETARTFGASSNEFATVVAITTNNGTLINSAMKSTLEMTGAAQLREWKSNPNSNVISQYYVHPVLMVEFGSGLDAIKSKNPELSKETGTGSLGNAGTLMYWGWYDLQNNYHTSSGNTPVAPMDSALVTMEADASRLIREVFF